MAAWRPSHQHEAAWPCNVSGGTGLSNSLGRRAVLSYRVGPGAEAITSLQGRAAGVVGGRDGVGAGPGPGGPLVSTLNFSRWSNVPLSQCLWCNVNKTCVDYPVAKLLPPASLCPLSSARWGVCWGECASPSRSAGALESSALAQFPQAAGSDGPGNCLTLSAGSRIASGSSSGRGEQLGTPGSGGPPQAGSPGSALGLPTFWGSGRGAGEGMRLLLG